MNRIRQLLTMAKDKCVDSSQAAKATVNYNWFLIGLGVATMAGPPLLLWMSLNILFWVPATAGLLCLVAGLCRMRASRPRILNTFGLAICLTAAAVPFVLQAYANRSGPAIKVVIPVGYQGEITVVKDRKVGKEIKLVDGIWILEIPSNGNLVVSDDYPFYMWHKETFVYTDGSPANVESLGTTAGNIRTGPNTSEGSTSYDGTATKWRVLKN